MHQIKLDSDIDFAGWREAARALVLSNVAPAEVRWSLAGAAPDLFAEPAQPSALPRVSGSFNVPALFVDLAKTVMLHRDPQRFALLYAVLWRLRGDPDLLARCTDPELSQLEAMAKAVRSDQHKMQGFVRFREIGREPDNHFVAWYEPEHHIVEATAPFFARRFADMPWSILTPERCAHWDGHALSFSPGIARDAAPSADRLEQLWLTYYASTFNPARLNMKAMQAHMPKRFWKNLPEAALIEPLIADAERRTSAMIDAAPPAPKANRQRRKMLSGNRFKHDDSSR